jgi:formate/nitrite transporter FocA (FNT family)
MQWLIESISNSVSYQAIFLLKFFSTIIYCLLMNLAGQLFAGIASLFSGSAVFSTHQSTQTERPTSSSSTARAEEPSRASSENPKK